MGLLVGKKGTALKALQCDLVSQLEGPHWGEELTGSDPCPSLHLHAGMHSLTITMKWCVPWRSGIQEPEKVRDAANAVQQSLLHHIGKIRRLQLERSAERRERKQERLRNAGQAYHAWRHHQRIERRSRTAAERALTLPPAGLSTTHFGGRKDLARHRRRTSQREKRQSLLHACAVLEQAYRLPEESSPTTTLVTGLPTSQPCNKELYQELLDDPHLSRLCIPSRPRSKPSVHDRCMPGALNRLRRYVKVVANVAEVPVAVDGLAGRRRKTGRHRGKHFAGNRATDLAEALDICSQTSEKRNRATIYMESSMARARAQAKNEAEDLA